jgi:hypothetical protein
LCELVAVGVGVAFFAARVRVGVGVADEDGVEAADLAEVTAVSEALRVLVFVADAFVADALLADAEGLAVAVLVGFFFAAVFFGVVFGVVFGVGVAFAVVFFAGVFAGVAAGLDFSARVGDADADDAVDVDDGLDDEDGVTGGVLGAGDVGVLGADELGVADGVVGAGDVGVGGGVVVAGAVGVGEVAVGDGDGLGDEVCGCSGAHDLLLGIVAALATDVFAARARLTPDVAVSRTLPAISVTVAGRACAKRMKRLTSAARCCFGTTHPQWSGFTRGDSLACVALCHPLDTRRPGGRHPPSYPVGSDHYPDRCNHVGDG